MCVGNPEKVFHPESGIILPVSGGKTNSFKIGKEKARCVPGQTRTIINK